MIAEEEISTSVIEESLEASHVTNSISETPDESLGNETTGNISAATSHDTSANTSTAMVEESYEEEEDDEDEEMTEEEYERYANLIASSK
jgi:hypothetical protein